MRALISVYDKSGLDDFARGLAELGWELVSSGGTADHLEAHGLAVTRVETVTGAPETNENLGEIEISSATLSITLPPSLFETGVIGITTAQSLRERGVGAPLGDTASFWKTHKTHAPRVYTNADLQRLHSS